MAQRGSRDPVSGDGGSDWFARDDVATSGARRVVALRPVSGPSPAAGAVPEAPVGPGVTDADATVAPAWAVVPTGRPRSASELAESLFPFGAELPWEPDPEAAAFLNAPRRPLSFYVAPFGTPPFGAAPPAPAPSAPAPVPRPTVRRLPERPDWGPAYPAGA